MPPRLRLRPGNTLPSATTSNTASHICIQCRLASLATTPAPAISSLPITPTPTIARYPPLQPPSHKPAEFRKSQLHRQYQSLLRSAPLIVIFQHNNLKATEWMAVRRELANALRKVDETMSKERGEEVAVGKETRITGVQTGIFASALKVVEFWDPKFDDAAATTRLSPDQPVPDVDEAETATHGLSRLAWKTATKTSYKRKHGLEPILSGPLALLTLPSVSPQHLKAAISILAPSKNFPAPRRKANPAYHEPTVQNGLQKLLMLAARVEGKVFDMEGTKWVGGIEGGLEGLRGQLVAMLQGVGAGVTRTLEAAGRTLYVTVEGRRGMLEEESKGKEGSESS